MTAARPDHLSFFDRAVPAAPVIPKPLAGAAVAGIALAAIGSVAPWFRVAHTLAEPPTTSTTIGVFTDGAYTLLFALGALLALLAALAQPDTDWLPWAATVLIGFCATVAIFDWTFWHMAAAAGPDDNGDIHHMAWRLPFTALAALAGAIPTLIVARRLTE
jgi:hypothetical protein